MTQETPNINWKEVFAEKPWLEKAIDDCVAAHGKTNNGATLAALCQEYKTILEEVYEKGKLDYEH